MLEALIECIYVLGIFAVMFWVPAIIRLKKKVSHKKTNPYQWDSDFMHQVYHWCDDLKPAGKDISKQNITVKGVFANVQM